MVRANLIAVHEPAIVAKPILDATIFEERKTYRGLANTAGAYERYWRPSVNEVDQPLNQFVAPNEVSRGRWRRFSKVSMILLQRP